MEREYKLELRHITRVETCKFDWTMEHRNVLQRMFDTNGGGLEYRPNESDSKMTKEEVALCDDLEKMGLATLAHSTFFRLWRITPDGEEVLNRTNKMLTTLRGIGEHVYGIKYENRIAGL